MIDISNFTCLGLNSNCLFCSPANLPLLIRLNNLTLFLTSHFLLHSEKSWWIYFQNISRTWLYIWTSTAGDLDSLLHSLAPTVQLLSWHFSSVAQSCPTLCDPMDCSTPASLSVTNSRCLLKLMSIELMMPFNHPLLLLPSIFPSIRVFSNESVLHIRWPKYWSFNFDITQDWSPFLQKWAEPVTCARKG